jgi:DNA-directed RNA polymerase specialized sigma24 family protein
MEKQPRNTDPIERLIRLVELLIRLKLREMNSGRSQKDMILLLGDIGMSGGEIASHLGISPTTVDPTLSKARRMPSRRQDGPRASSKKG